MFVRPTLLLVFFITMNRRPTLNSLFVILATSLYASAASAADPWLVVEGKRGPGRGKHVVLVSGDEEYRSEEALPQLAQILAKHHGFKCTVLFSIEPSDGTINPNRRDNIPGLQALDTADLLIVFTRFRNLPDDQMKHLAGYIESGRPIMGLRTATHAFELKGSPTFARYDWKNKDWDGGFGRQVLGETWISHHGKHGIQGTRGILSPNAKGHPILRGIKDGDIYGPTDVYGVRLPLPGDSQALVTGQLMEGMGPTDKPVAGVANDVLMPIAWIKTYKGQSAKTARVFTTTMGSAADLSSEGMRRLLVNAVYWTVRLEAKIPARSNVATVGTYLPSPFKMDGFKQGVHPEDLRQPR